MPHSSEHRKAIFGSPTARKHGSRACSDAWTFTDVTGNYNNASGTITDVIKYGWGGFLQPLSLNRAFKQGSTIPVKFYYTDAMGNVITDPNAVTSLYVQQQTDPNAGSSMPTSWYAGADAAGVAANQFDFQTIVTHEVGHALGLGHSEAAGSVIYAMLGTGATSRALAVADLNVADADSGADALHALRRASGRATRPEQTGVSIQKPHAT